MWWVGTRMTEIISEEVHVLPARGGAAVELDGKAVEISLSTATRFSMLDSLVTRKFFGRDDLQSDCPGTGAAQ